MAKEKYYNFRGEKVNSEEDEQIINTIINHFKVDLECTDEDDIIVWLKDLQCRLKSLRSQPHWKPNEEQLEALWNTLHPDDPYYVDLSSLYDDLKKLL